MKRAYLALAASFLPVPAVAAEKLPPIPAPTLPADYQALSQELLRQNLRDGSSGQFQFRDTPYQMVCRKEVYKTSGPITIWMVNVWVNGTNAFGGFSGFQPMSVAIYEHNGQINYQSYTKAGGGALTRFGLCKIP